MAATWTCDTPWPEPQPLTPSATPLSPPSLIPRPRTSPEPIALHGVPFPDVWALYGACRGLDPNLFLPHRGEDQEQQIAVCTGCPVVDPCREYALAIPGLQGIWGGLNERQRRRIRRERVDSQLEESA